MTEKVIVKSKTEAAQIRVKSLLIGKYIQAI